MAAALLFGRDAGRFADARARMNESPLGAAALAGSPFPIDRHMTAQALGFDRPMANSLDAVSDRDFALESLAAASITAGHLSRLAEEIVVWMTPMFGFATLPDDLAATVDHVEVETIDRITLMLRDGRQVLWGSAEESELKAQVLQGLLRKVRAPSYDVSVPGNPVYGPVQ